MFETTNPKQRKEECPLVSLQTMFLRLVIGSNLFLRPLNKIRLVASGRNTDVI